MQEIAGRWLRVSSDAQDEDNQASGIDQHIAARGYATGPDYRAHDKSASKREHLPLLREAISDMRAGKINVLVIRNTDRIDRTEELGAILAEVKAAGGRIESVTEAWLGELSGLPGKIMTAVSEFQNAEYTRKLSVNVKDAQRSRRSVGSWASSLAPFGYAIVGYHADGSRHDMPGTCVLCYPARGGRKTVEPTEAAAIIPEIYARVIAGDSLRTVAAWLSDSGVPTEHGHSAWNEGVVRRMVQQPVYAGRVKSQGQTYMRVDAVVTQDVQDAALRALATRVKPGRQAQDPALCKGLRCGSCGAPMYRIRSGRGEVYANRYAYRCFGSGALRKGCGNNISLPVLDASVIERLSGRTEERMTAQTVPGHNWQAEIADTVASIRELDPISESYDTDLTALRATLADFRGRKATPDEVKLTGTKQSVGDYFAKLDFAGKREYIGQHEIKAHRADLDGYPNVLQVTMHGPSGNWFWADLPECP